MGLVLSIGSNDTSSDENRRRVDGQNASKRAFREKEAVGFFVVKHPPNEFSTTHGPRWLTAVTAFARNDCRRRNRSGQSTCRATGPAFVPASTFRARDTRQILFLAVSTPPQYSRKCRRFRAVDHRSGRAGRFAVGSRSACKNVDGERGSGTACALVRSADRPKFRYKNVV